MTPCSSQKTVALIDPLWVGHHPMYFSQFTAAFLRLGACVLGFCPEPVEAFHAARAAAAIADFDRRVTTHYLPSGQRSWFRGRFEGDPLRTFQRWKRAADALRDAERATGRRADLVFFPYLDSYLRFLPFPVVPELTLGRPWSGLYLRNHHHGENPSFKKSLRLLAKGDAVIRSPLCRGIGVLDERFITPLQRYTRQQVQAFPDVTDATLPKHPHPLAEELRRKAAGRRIIGLIGLERRKGLLNLLHVADLARDAGLPWYFACVGRFERGEYNADELTRLDAIARRAADGDIANVHFDPSGDRIPAEADYNSIFVSFDVAWAAYEGFQGSSGTLGKAAAFDIPCIATAGECIGHRIEGYRTGLTIPEGDSHRALDAIRRILERRDWGDQPLVGEYDAFRTDHGIARLDELLGTLLLRA